MQITTRVMCRTPGLGCADVLNGPQTPYHCVELPGTNNHLREEMAPEAREPERILLMRFVILVLLLSVPVVAQQPAGRAGGAPAATPKNLKVLAPDADIPFAMQMFNQALGVECIYCHVQSDYASDTNPKKDVARRMIGMVRQIDGSFPSSAGVFPAGYHGSTARRAIAEASSPRRSRLRSSTTAVNRWEGRLPPSRRA